MEHDEGQDDGYKGGHHGAGIEDVEEDEEHNAGDEGHDEAHFLEVIILVNGLCNLSASGQEPLPLLLGAPELPEDIDGA